LGDVWRDILWVGEEACRGPQAEALLEKIGARLALLEEQLDPGADRPRVAFLEWLQPFYVGGHWVPEMIQVAGGKDVLGRVRTPSFRIHLQDVVEAEPEILLIAPCGYTAQQAGDEYCSVDLPDQWNAIPAVRNGRVYALEASSYFSRPGPRLVTGIEILAKIFQPTVAVSAEAESAILPIPARHPATRAASL
jgi:iron complex transport system substrate-binding protein